jgi:hypothetical protein
VAASRIPLTSGASSFGFNPIEATAAFIGVCGAYFETPIGCAPCSPARKLIGAKPPLRAKHVWSIRTQLQVEDRKRDLAMFNLAIDSKLSGCDVVSLKVENVAPHGITVDRATVRQKKTGTPVRFELSEQTREAVDDYIKAASTSSQ